jgi:cellulose synthase/poly-beta-1,6-N-acetylglucosamine synthase-like glycosyltransferase
MVLPSYDVVIPTYREDAYIHRAIAALKEQTVKPGKIIIVDYVKDKIKTDIRETSVEVWEIYEPGIGAARAFGCERSTAECILNIDADSIPKKDLAQQLLISIKKGAVASFGFGTFGEGEDWERFAMGLFSLYKAVIPNGQCYAGLMVARYAYDFVGGFHNVGWEDTDLSLRLALSYPARVKYVPEAVASTSDRRLRGILKNPLAMLDYSKAYRGNAELDV